MKRIENCLWLRQHADLHWRLRSRWPLARIDSRMFLVPAQSARILTVDAQHPATGKWLLAARVQQSQLRFAFTTLRRWRESYRNVVTAFVRGGVDIVNTQEKYPWSSYLKRFSGTDKE
jgi:hypothetical protein